MAAFERQMQKEYNRKVDALLDQLLEALLAGDFERADEIQALINEATLKHEEKTKKFERKMMEFRNRHGQEEEEEPPPPPPSEEPVVD